MIISISLLLVSSEPNLAKILHKSVAFKDTFHTATSGSVHFKATLLVYMLSRNVLSAWSLHLNISQALGHCFKNKFSFKCGHLFYFFILTK